MFLFCCGKQVLDAGRRSSNDESQQICTDKTDVFFIASRFLLCPFSRQLEPLSHRLLMDPVDGSWLEPEAVGNPYRSQVRTADDSPSSEWSKSDFVKLHCPSPFEMPVSDSKRQGKRDKVERARNYTNEFIVEHETGCSRCIPAGVRFSNFL